MIPRGRGRRPGAPGRAPLTPSNAIAELNEPERLTEPVERYLEARQRAIDLLHEGQAVAEDADPTAFEEVQAELASTQRDPHYELAREIGFEECSKPLADGNAN